MFKHLSIAQHLFLLWFCCFDFVYSSLSRSAGFIRRCLNLFPTTVIPQHKRMKETLIEKHHLFILSMSQLPEQHYLNMLHFFFFLKHSEDRPLDSSEGCIDSDMFISLAKACWVSNKTSAFSFVVHVSVGTFPVTFMGGFFKQCFDGHGLL